MLSGTCDENATWVTYSLDNVAFYTTQKQGSNWVSSTNAHLTSGHNTIYFRVTYQRGDFWWNHTEEFNVNVDTTWVYHENGNTNLGMGAIAAIVAAIAIIAVIGVVLVIRRRGKKP